MRASWQTELQREFPLYVVCYWLGNSPRIAQQSYLLVTEDDFAKVAGVATVRVKGYMQNGQSKGRPFHGFWSVCQRSATTYSRDVLDTPELTHQIRK